ncbi:MAG: hypothetical protein HFI72_07475 [Peptococcaceae bacterium]|jgi:hypothetical protein|nr:hypothetical protein [Peptococcaceae bacterium]
MRKLQTIDVFNALRVVKRAGIKEQLMPYIKELTKKEKSIENLGIASVLTLVEILSEQKAEMAIYEVLSGPFEVSADDVAKMNLDVFTENLEVLSRENNLPAFFTALAGMITKK